MGEENNTEKMLKSSLFNEINRQCDFALIALNDLEKALRNGNDDKVWYSIHSFLAATANISKLVNPPKRRHDIDDKYKKYRDFRLKNIFSLEENSLFLDREARNHLEHLGERLEVWATDTERSNIADSNIMPQGSISGIDEKDMLRHFDPETYKFSFRGKKFDLLSYKEEILKIKENAEELASIPFWEL